MAPEIYSAERQTALVAAPRSTRYGRQSCPSRGKYFSLPCNPPPYKKGGKEAAHLPAVVAAVAALRALVAWPRATLSFYLAIACH